MSSHLQLSDITFLDSVDETAHPRYKSVSGYIVSNATEFAAYHQVFERLVAEIGMMTDRNVQIRQIPLAPDPLENTLFARLVGINQHNNERKVLTEEFLSRYDEAGADRFFSKAMKETGYYRYCLKNATRKKPGKAEAAVETHLDQHMREFVFMYENMKKAGGLVPNARREPSEGKNTDRFQYYDLPWAIDYLGYVKKRDGAHRRAVAAYIGLESLPMLVFDFGRLQPDDLKSCNPYIQEHFGWYRELIVRSYDHFLSLSPDPCMILK